MKKFFLKYWMVLLAVPAVLGLLQPGYFGVHDAMHPAWVFEMYQAFKSGQMPPKWGPDFSFGYGYPLFEFVYPLPYYLGAVFYSLGASLTFSVELVTILAVFGSFIFMYLWMRELVSKKAALIAALVYIYTPYRALDIYVRGALGETVAFAFLALLGYGVTCIFNKKDRLGFFVTIIGTAGLVLSHNLTAYLGLIFFGFYSLILFFQKNREIRDLFKAGVGVLLGLGISSYFWLPALIDKKLMVNDAVFNFVDHFPFIKQLIIPFWGHGSSHWGPLDEMSFQIGPVNLIIVAVVLLILAGSVFKKRMIVKENFLMVFLVAVFFIFVFMMNIRSMFLWQVLPLAEYFQFPWRMLLMTTLTTSLLAGFVVDRFKIYGKSFVVLIVIIIAGNLYYFTNLDSARVISDQDVFSEFFVKDPINGGDINLKFLGNTEEYLRLPKATLERPTMQPDEKIEAGEGLQILSVKEISSVRWEVETKGVGVLTAHIYNLPGWTGKVNGRQVKLETGKPWGQIEILIEESGGNINKVEIYYQQPESAVFANLISVILFGGVFFYSLYPQPKKKD
jgi:hypothetical protein